MKMNRCKITYEDEQSWIHGISRVNIEEPSNNRHILVQHDEEGRYVELCKMVQKTRCMKEERQPASSGTIKWWILALQNLKPKHLISTAVLKTMAPTKARLATRKKSSYWAQAPTG